MNAATVATVEGVAVLVAEGACAGCRKPLVLIQLPTAKITDEDCFCFACAPTKRMRQQEAA